MSFAPEALTLKQADIDLLFAVCSMFGDVNSKELGEELNCTPSAAWKRWDRFKTRAFGDKGKKTEGESLSSSSEAPLNS
jgi:hypothetical protein